MLNLKLKNEAIRDVQSAVARYNKTKNSAMDSIIALHNSRVDGATLLGRIEKFINKIANTPKEFANTISEIKINLKNFESEVEQIEAQSIKVVKVGQTTARAGMTAGAGIAAFGPSAAMAVATTFGTASTGTAIASLSGAAATNAALAWLGGGALAAGGGGMAAGNAFLALAGPVGWTIGGAALLGGGLLMSSKNKEIAREAESTTRNVNKDRAELEKTEAQVNEINKLTQSHVRHLGLSFEDLISKSILDYKSLTAQEKMDLGTFVNNSKALSEMINRKVN